MKFWEIWIFGTGLLCVLSADSSIAWCAILAIACLFGIIMQQFSQKIEEDCRKAEAIKNADFRASEDGDWNVRRVSNGLYIPNSIELWEDMQ